MNKNIKLQFGLTREQAIDMILEDDSTLIHELSIDCNVSEKQLEEDIEDSKYNLDSFYVDCENHQKTIERKRNFLNKLMTHEIFEKGERLSLWKLTEKQKRLIVQ